VTRRLPACPVVGVLVSALAWRMIAWSATTRSSAAALTGHHDPGDGVQARDR
jgi:hypothetical protein